MLCLRVLGFGWFIHLDAEGVWLQAESYLYLSLRFRERSVLPVYTRFHSSIIDIFFFTVVSPKWV